MPPHFITPPDPGAGALAELKGWLAISTTGDDTALAATLRAALETCAAFTGTLPLAAQMEETLPAYAAWRTLGIRPVRAISAPQGQAPAPQVPPQRSGGISTEDEPADAGSQPQKRKDPP